MIARLVDPNNEAALLAKTARERGDLVADLTIGVICGPQGVPVSLGNTLGVEMLNLGKRLNGEYGTYRNLASSMSAVTQVLLGFLGIPYGEYKDRAVLGFTDGGGGTAGLCLAIGCVSLRGDDDPRVTTLVAEPFGWAGYPFIARRSGLDFREIDSLEVTSADIQRLALDEALVLQMPPHNGTGRVRPLDEWRAIARELANKDAFPILDVAYFGMCHAHLPYDTAIAEASKVFCVFLEAGGRFALALSPTKMFGSFESRPGAPVILFGRNAHERADLAATMAEMRRGGGDLFTGRSTAALVGACLYQMDGLKLDHAATLCRVDQARQLWRCHAKNTVLEDAFVDGRAGFFAYIVARPGAAQELRNAGIHCVHLNRGVLDTSEHLRVNVTALPEHVAQKVVRHIATLATSVV